MKTNQIIEMALNKSLPSFGEKFTRILIKMRILPVHINSDDTARFRFFSCNYLIFVSLYYILPYILMSLPYTIWPEFEISKWMEVIFELFGGNKTDALATFVFTYILSTLGVGTCTSVAKGNS